MADVYWTAPGTVGSFGVASNFSGGALPVDNDTVIFDPNLSQASVGAGLTPGAANDAIKIVTLPGYAGDIGSYAQPLAVVGVGTNGHVIKGSGRVHLSQGIAGDCVVLCDRSTKDYNLVIHGSTERLIVGRGRVRVLPGGSLDNALMMEGSRSQTYVLIEDGAGTGPSDFFIMGGTLISQRDVVAGASWFLGGGAFIEHTKNVSATSQMVIGPGATFKWAPVTQPGGTASPFIVGTFDNSENKWAKIDTYVVGTGAKLFGSVNEATDIANSSYDLRRQIP